MIISYRHRFVFFHLGKTGGSSVTLALLPQLGPKDIVIGAVDDALSRGVPLNRATWATLLHPPVWPRLVRDGLKRRRLAGVVGPAVKTYYRHRHGLSGPHATPSEVRRFLGPEWPDYFKFAFVRNPWDWMVSAYFWTYRHKSEFERPSFQAYLDSLDSGTPAAARLRRWYYPLTSRGAPVCDMVGRFEHMAEDLEAIRQRIGLPEPVELPHAKKSSSPAGSYREMYTPQGRDTVASLFADVIENYGYTF